MLTANVLHLTEVAACKNCCFRSQRYKNLKAIHNLGAVISCKNTVMKNEEIKKECEQMYAQIKSAEDGLKELRAECKHEKTFEGNYSWRVGNIQLADICEYCGSVIRYK